MKADDYRDKCIFCRIAAKKSPANIHFEDRKVVVFDDIKPSAPVHVLIVPKKHIKKLADIKITDVNLLGHCQYVAKLVALKLGIKNAFRLSTLSGHKAGQMVDHIHYHLIGGFK